MFYSISDSDKQAAIADAILMREREIQGYDLNITNYTYMLAQLPQDEWPTELAQYQQASAEQVPDAVHDKVSQYQFRDHMRTLMKTERAERAKSYLVYQSLIAQIPAANLEKTILAAIDRLTAPKTAV